MEQDKKSLHSQPRASQSAALQKVRKQALGKRFLGDVVFRTKMNLYQGLGMNLLYVLLKLISGVRYRSLWFLILAAYYFILALLRFSIIAADRRHPIGTDLREEFRCYRLCGIVLLLMNQTLAGLVIVTTSQDKVFVYPGILIYAMAVYAFYAVIMAIITLVRYRRHGSPLLSAPRAVSLTSAMVSMLALEIALTARFGTDAVAFRKIMTSAVGGVVCTVVLVMAIYMIVRSTKALKKLNA